MVAIHAGINDRNDDGFGAGDDVPSLRRVNVRIGYTAIVSIVVVQVPLLGKVRIVGRAVELKDKVRLGVDHMRVGGIGSGQRFNISIGGETEQIGVAQAGGGRLTGPSNSGQIARVSRKDRRERLQAVVRPQLIERGDAGRE